MNAGAITQEVLEFIAFPKVPRLRRTMSVQEKIDGTNAQVFIDESGVVRAGSRNRWLTSESDNFGFAAWVEAHADELRQLGPGRHYGEWWGSGIQRRYGLSEKRFSLFNAGRWTAESPPPSCCLVVPVLYVGPMSDAAIDACLADLRTNGSKAAPGYMNPEGIVVYHSASRELYKVTLDNDAEPKGKTGAAA